MENFALPSLPARKRDAHKGDFGRVLILAGSPRMTGAAWLCAEGAVRGGAGLVTLGLPCALHPILASRATSWMTLPLPDTAEGTFSAAAAPEALAFLVGCDAFAVGPGLGRNAGTGKFVLDVLEGAAAPAVVDADGLNLLEGRLEVLSGRRGATVLTPHPGEFARLSGMRLEEVQADREAAAAGFALKTGAVVALKGHRTVVTDGRRLFVNDTGNPGMASGGTGDVLTGVVAALLAGGLPPMDAAAVGVNVHGRAGDFAAARLSETSCCATDVLESLGSAFLWAENRHGG